jgi:hypothetical protein
MVHLSCDLNRFEPIFNMIWIVYELHANRIELHAIYTKPPYGVELKGGFLEDNVTSALE